MSAITSEIPPHIGRIAADARRVYGFGEIVGYQQRYLNEVVLLGQTAVIKVPRQREEVVLRGQAEATHDREVDFLWYMEEYMHAGHVPPVEVPNVLISNQTHLCHYTAFRYIEGKTYSEVGEQLNGVQKYQVGRTLGKFIAWMSETQDLDCFKRHEEIYSRNPSYDREESFANRVMPSYNWLQGRLPSLARKVFELSEMYMLHKRSGELEPTMIGHRDLSVENLIIRDNRLAGVIDFGIVSPTSAARELAPVVLGLGKDVASVVAQSYEAETGEAVPEVLIDLWAGMYLTDMCTAQLRANGFIRPEYVQRLRKLYPEEDWREA